MEISFDPKKDEWTKQDSGLSLSAGREIIRNGVAFERDERRDYGEERFVAFGYIGRRLHVCVFTIRGEAFHIISVRKANQREVKKHGR